MVNQQKNQVVYHIDYINSKYFLFHHSKNSNAAHYLKILLIGYPYQEQQLNQI